MQIRADILLLLDAHGPEALGAFGRFRGGSMVVALVGIGLRDAQREQGEREQLEDLRGGEGGREGREETVLARGGHGVGGGGDGAERAFN